MNPMWPIVLAAITLAAAVYAQREIPRFTSTARKALIARGLLLAVGLTFGYVAADTYGQTAGMSLLPFLIGFGSVHVPAAFILFFKRGGGAGKS
jgi:hypothetical protein